MVRPSPFTPPYPNPTHLTKRASVEHPGAEVMGVDLSPIQPSFAPPNCKFEIDDVTSPWTFPLPSALINIRALYGSIADWPALYALWEKLL